MKEEDTYEHARALTDEQIAKERAITDKLDVLECDVLELWDDYYDIPYGSKYRIRIRTELPGNTERKLYELIESDITANKDDELIGVLSAMTTGIYAGDNLVHNTDIAFWENPANWNMRKVEAVIMSYLSRLKEERESIYSFPGKEATASTNNP